MIDEKQLNELKDTYNKDKYNKIRRRILNKVAMKDLIIDNDSNLSMNFNINITTNGITDQQSSCRCWMFAGLNILREKVIEKCNLDNIELSANYLSFYDKIERFNINLERLISYKQSGKNVYDKSVSGILTTGQEDGGYFIQFAYLIEKYGIVPASICPETYQSSNTDKINAILSRLIRKFYIELEETKDEEKLKNKYLEYAYIIIANAYGLPPKNFDFEYTDKDNNYHIDRNITPKEFYDKYVGIDLSNNYVEIISYKDDIYKYNNLYKIQDTSIVSGATDNIFLNITPDEMIELVLEQLKNNEAVLFYCSTVDMSKDAILIDTLEKYGDIFGIDLTMNENDTIKTNGIIGAHCMLITGVNLVDNIPTKWKIENSWGADYGNDGYYIASNDWFNKNVYTVIINKKYLKEKHLKCLDKKALILTPDKNKF